MNYSLKHSAKFSNLKALMWDDTKLYCSRGYSILRYDTELPNQNWVPLGQYYPSITQKLYEKSKTLSRIKRSGFHHLMLLKDHSLLGVIDKAIVKLNSGTNLFQNVFTIKRGTRPLAISSNPQGHLFWGEYFNNTNREEVHIYASYDLGETWSIIYTFPNATIRHIHNILWDPYLKIFWIFTGDDHNECFIIKADQNMANLEIVFKGSQNIRCVAAIPRPEGLYFATDTPFEANKICIIEKSNTIRILSDLPSSSLSACNVSDLLFFSSAVEPSDVNTTKYTSLKFSENGHTWNNLVSWKKSALPSKLFQFANISLPTGNNSSGFLAATGISVAHEHMTTHIWEIQKRKTTE
ncbi:MAG: hypothetical protein CL885_01830 [Dehalococcoidia bacterium]|nr:hypothetical protein [Dehalococcoidia bacterium]